MVSRCFQAQDPFAELKRKSQRLPGAWLGLLLGIPIAFEKSSSPAHSFFILGTAALQTFYFLYFYKQISIKSASQKNKHQFPFQSILAVGCIISLTALKDDDFYTMPLWLSHAVLFWFVYCYALQSMFVYRSAALFIPNQYEKYRRVVGTAFVIPLLLSFLGEKGFSYLNQLFILSAFNVLIIWSDRVSRNSNLVKTSSAQKLDQFLIRYHAVGFGETFHKKLEEIAKTPVFLATSICILAALLLWVYQYTKFIEYLAMSSQQIIPVPLVKQLVITSEISKLPISNFALVNQLLGRISIFVSLASLFALVLIGNYFQQPTHILLTKEGLQLVWSRMWLRTGKLSRWNDLIAIRVKNVPNAQTFNFLDFVNSRSKILNINLQNFQTALDKALLLKAIEEWGSEVPRDSLVTELLQLPLEQSYTELWLQAFSSPPKRQRMKPLLARDMVRDGALEIIGALGVGGQGFAYLAKDTFNQQQVVLKEFILPAYGSHVVRRKALESFENEARTLKSLTHKKIVNLIDFFVEDHRLYLMLEYIPGLSLQELVRENGALAEQRVLNFARQMCEILIYLHGLTPPVVHRDFTPDNLICDPEDNLKLIDFNLAQEQQESTTGSIVGKHSYLPPEQFRGQARTQSDLYSLGATLFFLLTGFAPDPITSSHPAQKNCYVSSKLDEIVAKATSLEIANRYQTAQELLADVTELLESAATEGKAECPSTTLLGLAIPVGTVEEQPDFHSPINLPRQGLANTTLASDPKFVRSKVNGDRKKSFAKLVSTFGSLSILLPFFFIFAWFLSPLMRLMIDAKSETKEIDRRINVILASKDLRVKKKVDLATDLLKDLKSGRLGQPGSSQLAAIYVERGWSFLTLNDFRSALSDANSALKLRQDLSGYDLLANCYLSEHQFAIAAGTCDIAKILYEKKVSKSSEVANLADSDTEIDESEKRILSKSSDVFDSTVCDAELKEYKNILRCAAWSNVRSGKPARAIADLKVLKATQSTCGGLAEEEFQNLPGAVDCFKHALRSGWQKRADKCLIAETELSRLAHYKASNDSGSKSKLSQKLLSSQFWAIRKALILLDFQEAIRLCSKQIDEHPGMLDNYLDRALAFLSVGNSKDAKKDLIQVLTLQPENEEALSALGEQYFCERDYHRALTQFLKLRSLAPRAFVYLRIGQIYGRQNELENALSNLALAKQLDPSWDLARSEHGEVLIKMGKYLQAANELHGKFHGTPAEVVQYFERLARARHALNQPDAEFYNRQAIREIGFTPFEE